MLSKEECMNKLDKMAELMPLKSEYGYGCSEIDFNEMMNFVEQLIKEHFDLLEEYKDCRRELNSYYDMMCNPPKIDGNTSDGYHTFNELYHHRAVLFSIICNQNKEIAWKSKKHSDGSMYDGMFIVGINTPQGQYSYHYDIVPYWDLFDIKEFENAPQWDGHEPKDIDRLLSIESNPLLKFEEIKVGMWVWDKFDNEYKKVYKTYVTDDEDDCYIEGVEIIRFGHEYSWRDTRFEENRFYRKEVSK